MLQIIDSDRNVNLTAKFNLGQEVCVTNYTGYRKGVITGITSQTNSKGTIILYTIELYVGKKQPPKILKKQLEKHIYNTASDALAALAEQAAKEETSNDNSNKD